MEQEFEAVSPRGATWHRWDPHIHTPGTALNDRYGSGDPWSAFLHRIETAEPPIRALGVTDYCGIDGYVEVIRQQKEHGRLKGIGLIFPNVEFRLTIETTKGSGINLHLLFSPEALDHVERIRHALSKLTFRHPPETYRCTREDLIRLGRAFDASLTDQRAAYQEGVNQFKVSLEAVEDEFANSAWLRENCLVAVSGGGSDGTSGLQGDGGGWAATRKNIERFADIIFSANPKMVEFYLGRGAATVADLETKWSGRKPCLHGSDAHSADRVGVPDNDRRCWLHGDVTFETLRQASIEPEGRVHIGAEPPQGALPGNVIQAIEVSNAAWMMPASLPINPGMVAIIGARGSGKTALADFIATGAYSASKRLSPNSFLKRAAEYLEEAKVELAWANGERTSNEVRMVDAEDLWDAPHAQYLSQQFVERLCSSEGLDDSLVAEIQRVIFESHPEAERMSTTTFEELLTIRMQPVREARDRHRHALSRAIEGINAELVRKDGLPKIRKEREETAKTLQTDRADRNRLVPRGQEERTKYLEAVVSALEAKQRLLGSQQARLNALLGLQTDVNDFRLMTGPEWVLDAKDRRAAAGLGAEDWAQFKLDFTGGVDALLQSRIEAVRSAIARSQGAAVPGASSSGSNAPLIAPGSDLSMQSLALLGAERTRVQELVGIDAQNARRYRQLSEKITRAEAALTKLDADIERAERSDVLLEQFRSARSDAYAGIFSAVIEEERELSSLYQPLQERIAAGPRAVKRLSFSVRREVDIEAWAARGEKLLDLRKGFLRGRGELLKAAEEVVGNAWRSGSADEAAAAMRAFMDRYQQSLMQQRLEDMPRLEWALRISEWLYSTDHIQVGYGLRYEGDDIERLSPGTRGIVLLLLYLAIDFRDDRPLIIDQPEENLDPQSVFEELVPAFCEAKKRRQIIIVTHNANLVVNTDADQVVVARRGQHRPDGLPDIHYFGGGLENPIVREAVCSILEGGTRAFQERARRLRVGLTNVGRTPPPSSIQ